MASNEEVPMDVDNNDMKLPLPRPSGYSANDGDETTLKVGLWTPEEIEPKKFKSSITKTLQTWANKNSIKGDFTATEISEDGTWAVIQVAPASALQELLSLNGKKLSTKEKKEFSLTTITPVKQATEDEKTSRKSSFLSKQTATSGSVEMSIKDSSVKDDSESTLVALCHYWYLKNSFPEKMQQIERENGVRITENVSVAITADKESANPKKATDEFIQLVQACLRENSSNSIPLKVVGSEEWRNMLTFLKTDHKCQITISSDEITIFGPPQSRIAISKALRSTKTSTDLFDQERMNSFSLDSTNITSNFVDEKEPKSFERASSSRLPNAFGKDPKFPSPIKITPNFKDPFVSEGLTMEDFFWEKIQSQHKMEFDRVQERFNVRFKVSSLIKGKRVVTVCSRSEKNVSMESHAIRALLRVYQKAALFQMRKSNGPLDVGEEDLHRASDEENGATAKTSKGRRDYDSIESRERGLDIRLRDAEAKSEEKEEEKCPVCMDAFTNKTRLQKCKHEFCKECLDQAVQHQGPMCPVCKDVFGLVEGDQPPGTMRVHRVPSSLPGFTYSGTIEITYDIPPGTQTKKHPNPGQMHGSLHRTAYLPDNREGNEVLALLRRAFDQKLIFTVGMSRTTGIDNAVTWNDIHHKTSTHGGAFGYPDPDYLSRVKDELKAKGIK